MIPIIGEVVFSTWQAVFLIVLCFASLVMALYCVFFMGRLRSFMKHVNSLGGGMQGIRSHVDGVREAVEERIDKVEAGLREEFEQQQEELASSVSSAVETARGAQEKLDSIDQDLSILQKKLSENGSRVGSIAREVKDLRGRHASLRSDFDSLENELEGAVQRAVKHSYQSLEGSLLGALEALQDEMLRSSDGGRERKNGGARGRSSGGSSYRKRSSTKGQGAPDKIISAEPLFAETEKDPIDNGTADDVDVTPAEEQGAPTN